MDLLINFMQAGMMLPCRE